MFTPALEEKGELEKGELCSTNAGWNLHYAFAAAEMLEKL